MSYPSFILNPMLRTLALAKARCMPTARILQELSYEPVETITSHPEFVFSLTERNSAELPKEAILRIVKMLIESTEKIPSNVRQRLDLKLLRLVFLLEAGVRIPFALEFIQHKRKSRRIVGLRIIGDSQPNHKVLRAVLRQFQKTRDVEMIKTIARSSAAKDLSTDELVHLLREAPDAYWRSRIIEHLLTHSLGPKVIKDLSKSYSIEFLRAIARGGRKDYLSMVVPFLPTIPRKIDLNKAETIGLMIWAFGRLCATNELERLEAEIAAGQSE